MSNWDGKVPFNKEGDLLHYPSTWTLHEWRDAALFEATLKYIDYARGRSAAYMIFANEEGKEFTVFLTDFNDLVPEMVHGKVSGTWKFVKRGRNFGIKLV